MTEVFEGIRDHAQHHPVSFAVAIIIPMTGAYLCITGKSTLPALSEPFRFPAEGSRHATTKALSIYEPRSYSGVASSRIPVNNSPTDLIVQIVRKARETLCSVHGTYTYGIGTSVRNWTAKLPVGYLLNAVFIAALPGIFLLYVRRVPDSWAKRHQTSIANALHFVAFMSFANQVFGTRDLLAIALVMVAFDVFQRALGHEAADAITGDESEGQSQAQSAVETSLIGTHSVVARADFVNATVVQPGRLEPILTTQSGVTDTKSTASDPKNREVVQLQRTVTESKTTIKAKEVQLRLAKEELKNARETLNETFAEYSNLREELKTIKQTLGKDLQAIVYRKDIELFALRKSNEQKEKYIKEQDAKLEGMYRQPRATIEVRDAQLKALKDRLALMDRQASPKFRHDMEEGDHALEVRLLRVKKARNSPTSDEEKDSIIARLQEDLTVATNAAQDVTNQQAELQRAWDIVKKVQSTLKEEREKHAQTREQLQEASVKLTQPESKEKDQAPTDGRLPTIAEDERDQEELEAMFNAAQKDNLRLYAEVEALEQRLRESNARMFTAQQEAETVRQQLKFEKAINEDMETARPSVVHRVHFQRMEGQLKDMRDTLVAKDEEIEVLKHTISEKDHHVKDLRGEVDAAIAFHTQDQDEIERLKQSIVELQTTKQQLMLDHERLASQRTRQRIVSAERASARSSGATLIHELSPPLTNPSDEPASIETLPQTPEVMEAERNPSIQETPKRHLRSQSTPKSTSNRWSLMSSAVPPPELRELKRSRRKSLGLKDFMRMMVGKDTEVDEPPKAQEGNEAASREQDQVRMKKALAPKDRNIALRPQTANIPLAKPTLKEPISNPNTVANPPNVRPPNTTRSTSRYYAEQPAKDEERPKTATAEDEAVTPVSGKNWVATNKLKRRSLY